MKILEYIITGIIAVIYITFLLTVGVIIFVCDLIIRKITGRK